MLAVLTNLSTGARSLVMLDPIHNAALPGLPGNELPTPPLFPGHDLPGAGGPVDPGYGAGHPRPPHAGQPLPPLPPDMAHPGHPLPLPPQVDNGLPIYPARPDHALPPPGVIWPPLPPSVPQGKALAVIYISGVGARWTVIDTT